MAHTVFCVHLAPLVRRFTALAAAALACGNLVAAPVGAARAAQAAGAYAGRNYAPAATAAFSGRLPAKGAAVVPEARALTTAAGTLGYVAPMAAGGFVLVRADDELQPVKLHAPEGRYADLPPEFRAVIETELAAELAALAEMRRNGIRPDPRGSQAWAALAAPQPLVAGADFQEPAAYVPNTVLTTTTWNQDAPYNYYAPAAAKGPGGRAYAGCSATALAQILAYHKQPAAPLRDHSYEDTDGACTGRHSLSDAGLSDYAWADMPDNVTTSSAAPQQQAVGQLIYQCGVALESNFEWNLTGASRLMVTGALARVFGYAYGDTVINASADFFRAITAELDAGRPVYYSLYQTDPLPSAGHAAVCDGYRNTRELHLNLGWSGSGNVWYDVSTVAYGSYLWTRHYALLGVRPLPVGAPAAPVSVSATDDTFSDKVRVTWADVSEAGVYNVYRNTAPSSDTASLVGSVTEAAFDDTGAVAGTLYYYWVKAANAAGDSPFSAGDTGRRTTVISLAEALDLDACAWATGGAAEWLGRTGEAFDGSGAARSGALGNSRQSWLQTSVTGPGVLTFWWKVSSERGHDYLIFLVDGAAQPDKISGAVDWQKREVVIPEGPHEVMWLYRKDWGGSAGSDCGWVDRVSFASAGLYLAVDLSDGAAASNYPVAFYDSAAAVPGGVGCDLYRTSRLLLRRLPPGVFAMGSPAGELGRGADETPRRTCLSDGGYMGVYEVTQEQWRRVMGTSPSAFSDAPGSGARPVESVSYSDIRGAGSGAAWPQSAAADDASFIGRLRDRTGISAFDLPTEAQWEYACRAGTATAVNTGRELTAADSDSAMSEAARYGRTDDSSPVTDPATATAGCYAPNAWGLYDMHGNVAEWCRDWYGPYDGACTNPVGVSVGTARVSRGGYWGSSASGCRSAARHSASPESADASTGFRLMRALPLKVTVSGGAGGGFYLAGASVAVEAAAPAAGCRFARWDVDPPAAGLGLAFEAAQASAVLVVPPRDVRLTAVFEPKWAQTLSFSDMPAGAPGDPDFDAGARASSGLAVAYRSSDTSVAVIVGGKVRMLRPGTAVITASQPGDADYAAAEPVSALLTVKARVSVALPNGGGAVEGAGLYDAGQSVRLVARPLPGFAFQCWDDGSAATVRSLTAQASNVTVTAWFSAASPVLPPVVLVPRQVAATVGVLFNLRIPVWSEAAPAVKVGRLPAGLVFDAKTATVSGVPSRAGTFRVACAASNAGGAAAPATLVIEVRPLPAWAQGVFEGVTFGADGRALGAARMTVTALGRITGTLDYEGVARRFSAGGLRDFEARGVLLLANTAFLAGPATVELDIGLGPRQGMFDGAFADGDPERVVCLQAGSFGEDGVFYVRSVTWLYRNRWREPGMASVLTDGLAGYYTATLPGNGEYGSGYLALTLDAAGGVKTAGKLADGTRVSMSGSLIRDEWGRLWTFLRAAPKTYGGGRFSGVAEFSRPAADAPAVLRVLGGAPLVWQSLNPQAALDYGAGFSRTLLLVGGWYDRLSNLGDYYRGRELSVGTDDFASPPVVRVGPDAYESAWWDPEGLVLTAVTNRSGSMTGLAAPPSGAPVRTGASGYDYASPANALGFAISLTRATGIFKGSFKAWFDLGATPVPKTVRFEGALTPEREDKQDGVAGRGFFLWPDKIPYPDPSGTPAAYGFVWSYDLKILMSAPPPLSGWRP